MDDGCTLDGDIHRWLWSQAAEETTEAIEVGEERRGGMAVTVATQTTTEDMVAATRATEAAVPTRTRVVLAGRVATTTAAECPTVSLSIMKYIVRGYKYKSKKFHYKD